MRYHSAYTFDNETFHTEIVRKYVHNNVIDYSAFRRDAIAIAQNPSDRLKETFDELRYNKQLIDDPDEHGGNIFYFSEAYLTHLFAALMRSLSLSNNRFQHSYHVLEDVLPLAGWNKDEILMLVYGKPFDTVFDIEEHKIFQGLTNYGRVLCPDDTSLLLSRLKSSTKTFSSPEAKALIDKSVYPKNISSDDLLDMAYRDGVEMLEVALYRNETLYMILEA